MSDQAANQLPLYNEEHKKKPLPQLTTAAGVPIGDKLNSVSVGPRGPLLMQDAQFMDEMAHFDRERIPERVVHAKGGGAFGYLECTHDISKYTKAAPFSKVGKKTDVLARFSTVGGESGSADTVRDPRGFAIKLYTDQGNWDLVGNNTPIFFIRDPILFPSFIHTQKRNPRTHLKDPNMIWDFQSLRPETTHQFLFLFSDRGIPDGYRHMNGYGSHTFKMVNDKDEAVYCKFHFKTKQGIKNIPTEKAATLSGTTPDYSLKDLYNAIESGNHPEWTLFIQVMTYDQAEACPFNPFDLTKVWPHQQYPLIPAGKMVLNRNPRNYFLDIEQSAFCPSNMIPGIEASPDKMLQGRIFSYNDTHRHRLGVNFNQIPVNRPRCPYSTYERDGSAAVDESVGDAPNYYPNSFSGPKDDKKFVEHKESITGDIYRHESGNEDNYSQPKIFYEQVLNADERDRLAVNIAEHLHAAAEFIRARTVKNFGNVNEALSAGILKYMEKRGVKTNMKAQL